MVVVGACLTRTSSRNQHRLQAWGPMGAPEGCEQVLLLYCVLGSEPVSEGMRKCLRNPHVSLVCCSAKSLGPSSKTKYTHPYQGSSSPSRCYLGRYRSIHVG